LTLTGLARACHPLPSAAVTAFAAALGLSAGLSGARTILLGAAVLTGQLSIGWLNDYRDRELDRTARRPDKPLATGQATDRSVGAAASAASALCVGTSLGLGWQPGLIHLLAVGSAYSYDLWLKSTVLSWLPFALSFGLLPSVVTTALPDPRLAPAAIWTAGAALGVGAHFANTVKDTAADALTGVRGLPQRIGPRWSLRLGAACVAAAGISLVAADPGSVAEWVCAAVAFVAALIALRAPARLAFPGVIVSAALVVAGLVLSGRAIQ
jgi:4-hydroxybenzoate polyprenyltransferase